MAHGFSTPSEIACSVFLVVVFSIVFCTLSSVLESIWVGGKRRRLLSFYNDGNLSKTRLPLDYAFSLFFSVAYVRDDSGLPPFSFGPKFHRHPPGLYSVSLPAAPQ